MLRGEVHCTKMMLNSVIDCPFLINFHRLSYLQVLGDGSLYCQVYILIIKFPVVLSSVHLFRTISCSHNGYLYLQSG